MQTLCADSNGFSLHAVVRCGTDDRQELERQCLCLTRPALGQLVLNLKAHWRDDTTHLVISPLKFMQRQAALIARPGFGGEMPKSWL